MMICMCDYCTLVPYCKSQVATLLASRKGEFRVERRSDPLAQYNLIVNPEGGVITLEKLSRTTAAFEVEVSIPISSSVVVLLDPSDSCLFTIRSNSASDEVLITDSNITRDIIAMYIRQLCAPASSADNPGIDKTLTPDAPVPVKPIEPAPHCGDSKCEQLAVTIENLKSHLRHFQIELDIGAKERVSLREAAQQSKMFQGKAESAEIDRANVERLEKENTKLQEQLTTLRDTIEAENSMMHTKNEAFKMLQIQLMESSGTIASLQDKLTKAEATYAKVSGSLFLYSMSEGSLHCEVLL
jgi:hypothetical protein